VVAPTVIAGIVSNNRYTTPMTGTARERTNSESRPRYSRYPVYRQAGTAATVSTPSM
jgi:hypothetical protein